MRKLLTYWLLFLFALQGTVAVAMQQARLSNIEIILPNDIEIICTGSAMRYISVSASLLANRFIFVEPPVSVSKSLVDEACPAKAQRDQQPTLTLPFAQAIALYLAITYQPIDKPRVAVYQQVIDFNPETRAPPSILSSL